MKNKDFEIKETEMLEALNRSGYLLESEISATLAKSGFFVESNQVMQDPLTGKSREIDLIAEYYNSKTDYDYKGAAKIKLVFEIKNNRYPIVLLTRFEFTPTIEDWMGLKEGVNLPMGMNYDGSEIYYENLIHSRRKHIYTQYCSFHKKRENHELMALHPENIHSGLMKITHICEEHVEFMDTDLIYEIPEKDKRRDGYFRHFLFMPVLLINDNLYEHKNGMLEKVESSILVHNYHYKNEPKMAYVYAITKKGFSKFMNDMIKLQDETDKNMFEASKSIL